MSKISRASDQDLPSLHVDPLLSAARRGETESILSIYIQKKDLTVTDSEGNNAIHLAAKNSHVSACRLLIILTSPLNLWKNTNRQGLTPSDLAVGEDLRADFSLLSSPPSRSDDIHSKFNDRLVRSFPGWDSNMKLLVSLDGGGIKTLIMNQILLHLDSILPGGICDRIDWLAGTSSGGVLGMMMGIDRSLDECRLFLLENKNRVFCGKSNTKIPKHDGRGMEEVSRDQWGGARMHRITKMKVVIPVADSRKSPSTLLLFRSFSPNISEEDKKNYQYLDPSRIVIWKAARCTTAAPYYFDSFNGLSDGGLVANNPTQVLMTDFFQVRKLEALHRESQETEISPSPSSSDKIGVILSLGTGNIAQERTDGIDVNFPKVYNPFQMVRNLFGAMGSARNAVRLLITECTSSGGQPTRYAREWAHSLQIPFFRFSPHLTQDIAMDSTGLEEIIQILWETELYVRGEARIELVQLAKLLETKELVKKDGDKAFDCDLATESDLRSETQDLRSTVDQKKS